ncbi:hypothetical protein A1O3_06685 [Capronia epimyces CBS 606.96]|uniref:UBC core domain-containing protein n=1 Tax=Capronia epimyces CBS 606.96 TaxID=1182542 RepID=W9XZU9_9EURO|nr:uncharacterized protein A1O3_06685 [Capronia epimyces CBS 606.96]EXJ82870.1 hypothetical protein A1O3_06685 [Capronia epimyces CBS 606.96]
MSTPLLPSFRRQQLVLDFSSLRHSCPAGVYLSLTPGNPSLWAGALFVRKGPYTGAVLRFQISFPDTYPDLPPRVTFSSDIFHPLVVPLTTYTFTANAGDASGTVSASDTDRLPPGAFSLRYGFPGWFRPGNANVEVNEVGDVIEQDRIRHDSAADGRNEPSATRSDHTHRDRRSIILGVLQHLQDAFQDETVLDNVPLDAAGDPSAWHAWRAHRGLAKRDLHSDSPAAGNHREGPSSPKHPGEWKWDGVWESRVNNGIDASVSEAVLFGSSGGGRSGNVTTDMRNLDPHQRMLVTADRQIRFAKLDEEQFEAVKGALATYESTVIS